MKVRKIWTGAALSRTQGAMLQIVVARLLQTCCNMEDIY